MIQLIAEITPDRYPSPGRPPCRKEHVHEKQHAQDACRTHPQADEQQNTDEQFENADNLTQKYGVRQDQAGQNRPVKTHGTVGYVILEIALETAMRKRRPGHLIFAE